MGSLHQLTGTYSESKRLHLEVSPAILICYEGKYWFIPVNNSIARVPLSCKNPSFTLSEATQLKRIALVAFKTLISHQEH